tara:strand:+ start:3447 stop:4472 length:1026 start_codon:yes stop_codon:yes gene_type:complete
MDLYASQGLNQANMFSQRAQQQSQNAYDANRELTQIALGDIDTKKKLVQGAQGNAEQKTIADSIVGGLVGGRVVSGVNQFRTARNAALKAKGLLEERKLGSGTVVGEGDEPLSQVEGRAVVDTRLERDPDIPDLGGEKFGEVPASGLDSSVAGVKAPTPAPQVAPNPEVSVSGSDEAGGALDRVQAAGSSAVDSAKSKLKGLAGEVSESGAGKLIKGAGVAGSAAVGVLDLAQDLKSKSLGGKGANWEQKVGNVFQMGGSVADVAGFAGLGPLADIAGLGLGAIGSIFSGIGDEVSGDKAKEVAQANVVKAQNAAKAAAAAQASTQQASAPTVEVSYGRSV